jgi:hypothetical protein
VFAATAACCLIAAAPLSPREGGPRCSGDVCALKLTAAQLLRAAERLVLERRFDEAAPLIDALRQAPDMKMQYAFLKGYVAVETGDLPTGARQFRAVLADHPNMTRARLELARVLLMQGKDKSADHHFRLAAQDRDLPPEIGRTIYAARSLIRERRVWSMTLDLGFAPDTNINNATGDKTVDLIFGNTTLPARLNDDARRKSGVGQTATLTTGLRLRLSDGLAVTVDANGQVLNYKGKMADDISTLIAAGPEVTLNDGSRLGVAAVGARRWYGGRMVTEGLGGRVSYQKDLGTSARLGVQLEMRDQNSGFSPAFDGSTSNAFISYERVINRALVGSATLFARREDLRSDSYSSTEIGGNLGIGGELPHGINAGISGGVSHALFDAPLEGISIDPTRPVTARRQDWRLNGRLFVGSRSLSLAGFSPSLTYTFSRTISNIGLYETNRHRILFGAARFF